MTAKPKKHNIAGCEDVFLYTTQEDSPIGLLYEIECARLNRVIFTLDFSGSENFELDSGGLTLQTTAEPFKRRRMGKLLLNDPTKPAKLSNKYTWTLEEPDYEAMALAVEHDRDVLKHLILEASRLGFGDDSLTPGGLTLPPASSAFFPSRTSLDIP